MKKPATCELCEKTLTNNFCLKMHIMKIHGDHKTDNKSKKLYECDICGISAPKSHLKNHQNAKVDCDICNKTFKDLRYLKNHNQSVHEKLKPFKCDRCELSFGSLSKLYWHVKIVHDKVNSCQCKKCGKTFSDFKNLESHNLSFHENIRPFKCDLGM